MDPEVRKSLLEVNRRFYQSLGAAFADTRGRPQPGIVRVLDQVKPDASVLDLGCGHGLVADHLSQNGHEGTYLGIDSSPELLRLAQERTYDHAASFELVDMAEPDWQENVSGVYDLVCAFAVLHHLPGAEFRRRWSSEAAAKIAPGGTMAVSVWNFLSDPSLRERVLPFGQIGLDESSVESGDYLVDWRHQGPGIRYVHHFTAGELQELAEEAGLEAIKTFHSDGRNKRLGLYQIWERPDSSPRTAR